VFDLKEGSVLIGFREWMEMYHKIVSILGISEDDDKRATQMMSHMIEELGLDVVSALKLAKKKVAGNKAFVFGCGPSLEEGILKLKEKPHSSVLIAADGATKALMKFGLLPEIIVTDLDGDMNSILNANERGSILFVHAHGDNMELLKKYLPFMRYPIVGTTQVIPTRNVFNFFGFTDGDRATFIALRLGAREIHLVGMDFGNVVGKYSKPYLERDTKAWKRKFLKLKIGEEIIDWLSEETDVKIIKHSNMKR